MGEMNIFESDINNKVEISLDKNFAPVHWVYDSAAFKGTFDMDFADSPIPAPGDLRGFQTHAPDCQHRRIYDECADQDGLPASKWHHYST